MPPLKPFISDGMPFGINCCTVVRWCSWKLKAGRDREVPKPNSGGRPDAALNCLNWRNSTLEGKQTKLILSGQLCGQANSTQYELN